MAKEVLEKEGSVPGEEDLVDRRAFLLGLGKWSLAVIGGALMAGALLTPDQEAEARGAWVNRGGGGGGGAWGNRAGGGGAWANRQGGGGAWANGGRAWINGGGVWINNGANWINRGGSWINGF